MRHCFTILLAVLVLPFWLLILAAGFIWPTSKVWKMAGLLLVAGSMAVNAATVGHRVPVGRGTIANPVIVRLAQPNEFYRMVGK